MRDQKTIERRNEILKRARAILSEEFDDALILVSHTDEESNTFFNTIGCGNAFSHRGMAESFIENIKNKSLAVNIADEVVLEE